MISWLRRGLGVGCLLLGLWLGSLAGQLHQAAAKPVDAILVLGGSIQREIQVAQQRSMGSDLPILISQGSADPCIYRLFQRAGAVTANVWLEKCAQSTFDNFRWSVPVLKQWGARHVRVITSSNHLPRAQWVGQIILGSHGLWTEIEAVTETGRPGNQENALKTLLDVSRSLVWAVLSQVYQPRCSNLTPLAAVNLADWQDQGYKCEHQADLDE